MELRLNVSRIMRVLYGISFKESIDITEKFKYYLLSFGQITKNDNIIDIIGNDPYPKNQKNLIIKLPHQILVIKEIGGKITRNIIVEKNLILPGHVVTPYNILFYVIYHDNKSYEKVAKYANHPYIKLIKIPETKYFESIIFKYLFDNKSEWISKNYVGILTYSYERKTGKTIENTYHNVAKAIKLNTYDVFTFSFAGSILSNYLFHPNLQTIYNYLFPKLGIFTQIEYDQIPFFCCNYWMARIDIMVKYVNFINQCFALFENKADKFITYLINGDAGYIGGKVPHEKLIRLSGHPYYTHHCFTMERLPCIYFWINKYKMLQI